MDLIRQINLHHLSKNGSVKLDQLITAVIKSWMPKTNAFHFNNGEVMIILEDAVYLYGFPVDWKPITCQVLSKEETAKKFCQERLSMEPQINIDIEDSLSSI